MLESCKLSCLWTFMPLLRWNQTQRKANCGYKGRSSPEIIFLNFCHFSYTTARIDVFPEKDCDMRQVKSLFCNWSFHTLCLTKYNRICLFSLNWKFAVLNKILTPRKKNKNSCMTWPVLHTKNPWERNALHTQLCIELITWIVYQVRNSMCGQLLNLFNIFIPNGLKKLQNLQLL